MSSILTNNSAMNALQTLKSINKDLSNTQTAISTGKDIASAKDNSAIWAISKVMESDVSGFKAISDSLSLGESTVAVARNAAETVTDLMKEIKGKIVSSQEANVDRAKIQTDITALREQITSVVGAAQFNGLNLINGKSDETVKVLASLDRAADGSVAAKNVNVTSSNLSQDEGDAITTFNVANASVATGASMTSAAIDFADADGNTGGAAALSKDDVSDTTGTDVLVAGDLMVATIGEEEVSYTVQEGDALAEIVAGFNTAITDAGITGVTAAAGGGGELEFDNASGAAIDMSLDTFRGRGDLFELSEIDVTTSEGAQEALAEVEGLIQTSIDSAAAFGSAEMRIGIQNEFVGKLMDSMKSGIGSLVDADMEAASARLTALQTQQQLGVQALSIANQAPQTIMQLFR